MIYWLLFLSFSLDLRRAEVANRYVADVNSSSTMPTMFSPAQPTSSMVPPPTFPTGASLSETSQDLGAPVDPNMPTPAAFDDTVPKGWNDPPALSGSRKVCLLFSSYLIRYNQVCGFEF